MSLPSVIRKNSLASVERALTAARGNVTMAARTLGVPAAELRDAVRRIPYLMHAALEGAEQALDEAEAIILDGLRAEALNTRLSAAGFILAHSMAAQKRGWKRQRADLTGRPRGRPPKADY